MIVLPAPKSDTVPQVNFTALNLTMHRPLCADRLGSRPRHKGHEFLRTGYSSLGPVAVISAIEDRAEALIPVVRTDLTVCPVGVIAEVGVGLHTDRTVLNICLIVLLIEFPRTEAESHPV